MKCYWCGKEFTPLKNWQRYCSPACRVAANRKRLPKDEVHTQETVLIRLFRCLQCGEVVNVYDPFDNRFKFCCVHCEKLYWKHPEKKREKGIRQFQCHACGKNVIVTDPLDRRRFYCSETCREAQHRAKRKVIREQKKKDKCLGIRLIFTNLSYSLNSLKERVYHESYLQNHLE